MQPGLRRACLIAAVLLLLILPIGRAGVLLALFVAADLAAAALLLRPDEPPAARPVVALAGDTARLALLRRTVPRLRMRRPAATVEAQMRWREAAQGDRSAKRLLLAR